MSKEKKQQDKLAKRAAALRANLKRRKASDKQQDGQHKQPRKDTDS